MQNVLITGTGRPYALGFNLVKRYLEHGDCVFASIRRPSEALEALRGEYPDRLHILTMDIASTDSVNHAAEEAAGLADHLDLIINNATTASALAKPTEERHICGVCGYIMDGETPDKCPMCKSPSTKFNVL